MRIGSLPSRWFFWAFAAAVFGCGLVHCDVSYDSKAVVINGQRRILFSGSIHYPRSTPEMWEVLIGKAKAGGVDVIETYVFWNGHEPSPGNYYFEERYDLVRFVKTIQRAGLYAVLRIGPYVCAEWNFGGFPVWLKFVPGIRFRTDNEPFKMAMKGFTKKIVSLVKSENLFASQGGPIIFSQIENEFGGWLESKLGEPGRSYMNWAAQMAVGMGTGVPWVMCKQDDAPDPVINTCNGFYCDGFKANKPYKPTMWTEAWTGWFSQFGGTKHERSAQDLAFAVANFIQKGGSFVNYYMFHGGTNFGRTAGGPFVTTSYDYDAPIDEYGLVSEPKYSHLKELHRAIKQCEGALVSSNPTVISLGSRQKAHVYSSGSECAAFLSNYDTEKTVKVLYENSHYTLPPWSISILKECQDVIFNTAKVGAQTSHMKMVPTGIKLSGWVSYNEDVTSSGGSSTFKTTGLLEQINVTRDSTDYLLYTTTVDIEQSESFLSSGNRPTLVVQSTANVVYVLVNGIFNGFGSGSRDMRSFVFAPKINLRAGHNTISLLSAAVGIQNIGGGFEQWPIGVTGSVVLQGLDRGTMDLTTNEWAYQVGLQGETMNLAYPNGVGSADWAEASLVTQKMSLTWHKASFDAPDGDEPLALDLRSMGKGQAWINGRSIGRYSTAIASGNCTLDCSYIGFYRPSKCSKGCGKPTQSRYHVPREWLKPKGNLLVLFEELGGYPAHITLVKRTVGSVCSNVAEYHPNFKNWQAGSADRIQETINPAKVRLGCNPGQVIKRIKFASYGTPLGTCGDYKQGTCHAVASQAVVEKRCVGKMKCTVSISNSVFGSDPCPYDLKRLYIEAKCA